MPGLRMHWASRRTAKTTGGTPLQVRWRRETSEPKITQPPMARGALAHPTPSSTLLAHRAWPLGSLMGPFLHRSTAVIRFEADRFWVRGIIPKGLGLARSYRGEVARSRAKL